MKIKGYEIKYLGGWGVKPIYQKSQLVITKRGVRR
jgi:hypothetical protein